MEKGGRIMQFRVDKEKRTILIYDEETKQMRFLYMLDNNIDWNDIKGIHKVYWENKDKFVELGGALSSGVKLSAPGLAMVGNKIAEENPGFQVDTLKESIVGKIEDPKTVSVDELLGVVDETMGTNYTELYQSVTRAKAKPACLVEENKENGTVLLYRPSGEVVMLRRTDDKRNIDFAAKFQSGDKDFFDELGRISKSRIEFQDENIKKFAMGVCGFDGPKQAQKEVELLHVGVAYAIERLTGVSDEKNKIDAGCRTLKWPIDIATYAKENGKTLDADEVIREFLGEFDFGFFTNYIELYEKAKQKASQVTVEETEKNDGEGRE